MSGVFGLVHWRRRPADAGDLDAMRAAVSAWARDGCGVWLHGEAALGQARTYGTVEDRLEAQPAVDQEAGWVITSAARLDYRDELARELGLPLAELGALADGDLVRLAYRRWGARCAEHLLGDWAFAAWHPSEQRLVLARDVLGNTSLYYHHDEHQVAFASDRRALLALEAVPRALDDLFVAQVLVVWPDPQGARTACQAIRRVPPGHVVTATATGVASHRYERLADTPLLRLRRREEYAEGLREVFDAAVRSRLRTDGRVAATLSGGLDSGAVTATAALALRERGGRLTAYTAVPIADPSAYCGSGFGDELPHACAMASAAGNIDLREVPGRRYGPLEGVAWALRVHGEPGHAAGNYYWMAELFEQAAAAGARLVLTGQLGNAGWSWTGEPHSQPWWVRVRHQGWQGWLRGQPRALAAAVKRRLPLAARSWLKHRRTRPGHEYGALSAINPRLAERLRLWEQQLADPLTQAPRGPMERRARILGLGQSLVGAIWAEVGAATGAQIVDPTADPRVLRFALSIPDRVFIDPATGLDRWVVRAAMADRLPDEVRLCRRRGRQAGDLVPRLRAAGDQVAAALAAVAAGPAADYLDSERLALAWQRVRSEDTPRAYLEAGAVLMRGLMAGLFVNEWHHGSTPT